MSKRYRISYPNQICTSVTNVNDSERHRWQMTASSKADDNESVQKTRRWTLLNDIIIFKRLHCTGSSLVDTLNFLNAHTNFDYTTFNGWLWISRFSLFSLVHFDSFQYKTILNLCYIFRLLHKSFENFSYFNFNFFLFHFVSLSNAVTVIINWVYFLWLNTCK